MKLDHGRHLSFPNAFDGVCGGLEENRQETLHAQGGGLGRLQHATANKGGAHDHRLLLVVNLYQFLQQSVLLGYGEQRRLVDRPLPHAHHHEERFLQHQE